VADPEIFVKNPLDACLCEAASSEPLALPALKYVPGTVLRYRTPEGVGYSRYAGKIEEGTKTILHHPQLFSNDEESETQERCLASSHMAEASNQLWNGRSVLNEMWRLFGSIHYPRFWFGNVRG
jgi:hypothetical protein